VTPRRRKADKNPGRESFLESRVALQDEEINLLRATNTRLRTELARLQTEMTTKPMEIAP